MSALIFGILLLMRRRNTISAIFLLALTIGYGVMTANLPSRAIEGPPNHLFSMGRDSLPVYPVRISAHSRFVARGEHQTHLIECKRWKIFSGLTHLLYILQRFRN